MNKEEQNMKLGSQFYSIRDLTATPEGLREAFRQTKEIGYDVVQISGIGAAVTAKDIAACVREFDLPVVCTHIPFDRLVNETDTVIAEHKLFGCPEIGIGGIGSNYATIEEAKVKFDALREAVKKVNAAGLTFGFHNHAGEFRDLGGTSMYETMIEEYPEFNFIHDVYWTTYAGLDPVEYVYRLKGRIVNLHFKDMAATEDRPICACGEGVIDFKRIYDACLETGVKNILIEQDNAPASGDSMGQMAISYKNIAPLFGK